MDTKDYAVRLMRRCASHNPFTIVRELDILLIYCPLIDLNGFYQYHKRNHIIYLSEDLEEHEARFVLAHELGHMQMHCSLNTVFMDTKTFYPHSRFERQANAFAVELLLPDDLLREHPDCSIYQLAESFGVPQEFVELKRFGNRQ